MFLFALTHLNELQVQTPFQALLDSSPHPHTPLCHSSGSDTIIRPEGQEGVSTWSSLISPHRWPVRGLSCPSTWPVGTGGSLLLPPHAKHRCILCPPANMHRSFPLWFLPTSSRVSRKHRTVPSVLTVKSPLPPPTCKDQETLFLVMGRCLAICLSLLVKFTCPTF